MDENTYYYDGFKSVSISGWYIFFNTTLKYSSEQLGLMSAVKILLQTMTPW